MQANLKKLFNTTHAEVKSRHLRYESLQLTCCFLCHRCKIKNG